MQIFVSPAMKMKKNKYIILFLIIFMVSQLISYFFFDHNPVLNKRIIFGLFGSNLPSIFITTITISIILYYFSKIKATYQIGVIIMISGAFSNLVDRLVHGGVRDYIKVPFLPEFNIADIFIVFGIILSLIVFLSENYKKSR